MAVFLMALVSRAALSEEIIIDLSRGSTDALIDFVPPPAGSPDRVSFGKEGMRIRQTADQPGRATGITGFKSTLAASGDFTVSLEAKIRKLQAPSEGWGHGLIFCVYLDDDAQTVLKLNQVVYSGTQHQTMVEISGREVQQPFFARGEVPLTDGKLVIQRQGSEAVFLIQPDLKSDLVEVARQACPSSDIRTIEVWSTRVDKGNAPSDMTFKRLTIAADGFYTFKRPVMGWLTWWQTLILAHLVVISFAVGILIWQRRHAK